MDPSSAVAWSAAGASLAFAGGWLRQLRTRDATSVDLLWTLGIGAAAAFHAATSGGWLPRRILVAALAGLWAARLALHLAPRIGAGEDARYADLRRRMGARAALGMLVIYLAQAALVVALGLVFLVLARAELAGWRWSDALALATFAVALTGESVADRQLAAWRSDPAHRGRTCRAGLWRRSRHPNYFFEWLHWFTYPLLGLGLPHGAWLLAAPLGMGLLMRFVTGVPPAEAQALRSRGADYRAYQRETNAFFPGPLRRAGDDAAPRAVRR
jgi:steroid 5-alpha reductase family enzyme